MNLYSSGQQDCPAGETFPLAAAADAMQALLSRRYAGKIVLVT